MRKRRGTYAGTADRRRQIVRAAVDCFVETGLVETTMEEIRLRSGASNGSIYHHFRSKEQLAAAAYLEVLLDYQRGLVAELDGHGAARDGVFAMVRYHLGWVDAHPDWARFLSRMRHAEFMEQTEDRMAEQNALFIGGIGEWFARQVAAGALRRLPPEIYISLIFGPCMEFARHWLSKGDARTDLEVVGTEIAEAAWQALRNKDGA